MSKQNQKKSRKSIDRLREVLPNEGDLLIVTQAYPDPDALASAAALRALAHYWGETICHVASAGVLGRTENRALAQYLRLPYRRVDEIDFSQMESVAIVDAQPWTGPVTLPEDIVPDIVIDHHPIQNATRRCRFTDIRSDYGATSTILYEYLAEAGMPIETSLATALLYGIKSDTQDLGREASKADEDAYVALYPKANKRMLSRIEYSPLPISWFRTLSEALVNSTVHGSLIVSRAGEIEIPDMIGEIADLTLREESSRWTMCYGYFQGRMLLSLRTNALDEDAGMIMREIIGESGTGGGHRAMAGGQIDVGNNGADSREKLEERILDRLLDRLDLKKTRVKRLVRK